MSVWVFCGYVSSCDHVCFLWLCECVCLYVCECVFVCAHAQAGAHVCILILDSCHSDLNAAKMVRNGM